MKEKKLSYVLQRKQCYIKKDALQIYISVAKSLKISQKVFDEEGKKKESIEFKHEPETEKLVSNLLKFIYYYYQKIKYCY